MGDALFRIYFIRKKVIHIEVKIPKEIRAHRETIFFGLSARQFICAILAVALAAGIYLGLGNVIGKEAAADPEKVEKLMWQEVDKINKELPFFKKIRRINIRKEEFEKTTGKKIKRFVESNKQK